MSSIEKFRNQVSHHFVTAGDISWLASKVAAEVTPKTHALVKAATEFLEAQAKFEQLLKDNEIEVVW